MLMHRLELKELRCHSGDADMMPMQRLNNQTDSDSWHSVIKVTSLSFS